MFSDFSFRVKEVIGGSKKLKQEDVIMMVADNSMNSATDEDDISLYWYSKTSQSSQPFETIFHFYALRLDVSEGRKAVGNS